MKGIDRGKWLIHLTELSDSGELLNTGLLLSEGIREAARVLPRSPRPRSISLCTRQLLTAGSAALYLRVFPRSTEDGQALWQEASWN